MTEEAQHIATAVAALGDKIADELRVLEEILKTESDIGRRRDAERRYLAITEPTKDAAE